MEIDLETLAFRYEMVLNMMSNGVGIKAETMIYIVIQRYLDRYHLLTAITSVLHHNRLHLL